MHPPVQRLMAALAARGHEVRAAAAARPVEQATLVLGPGIDIDPMALGVLLGAWRTAPRARVLVISLLGVHPDARERRLRRLWEVEERARGSGMPSLTLRLAPLVGPQSPLWLKLRSRPRLPRGGRQLLNPVFEDDVVETLDRALSDRAPWDGWFELVGEEAMTLAELAELAASGASLPRGSGEWEPPLAEMREHRLSEARPWREHFDLQPASVRQAVPGWFA